MDHCDRGRAERYSRRASAIPQPQGAPLPIVAGNAENGMYRYKRIIGDRLRAHHRESQIKEALIAVNVINRMTALGMPESAKIVA